MDRELAVAPHVAASLARFHAALQARFGARLARVVLFGSQARGDADHDSDVDVLVLIDDVTPAERQLIIDLAYDADAADRERWAGLAPIAYDSGRFDALRAEGQPLAADIDAEGIAL